MFDKYSILFVLFTFGVSGLSLVDEILPHHTSEQKEVDVVADGKLPQPRYSYVLVIIYYKHFHISDHVLCRSCGGDIATSNHISYIKSPAAVVAFNDTLFSRDKVLVQVLPNNIFLQFPVITFLQATCLTVGEVKSPLIS